MSTNRGDMPAMPQSVAQSMDGGTITSADFAECQGMTIREKMAMAAMQGMATEPNIPVEIVAKYAVMQADALLAELERTK